MARPAKASVDKLSAVIAFRVTPAEHATLSAKAALSGVALSEFARLASLGRAARPHRSSQTAPAAPFALVDQLRRVGVNLNQLARTTNAGRDRSPEALQAATQDLQAVLADVRNLLEQAQGDA